jgi:hypothetical protein
MSKNKFKKMKIDQSIRKLSLEPFPDDVQHIIRECARVYGTNPDFWVSGLLAASSSAIGTHAVLHTKYDNYPSLWVALVAPSGYGKTEPLKFFYAPLHNIDGKNFEKYKTELDEYREKNKGRKSNASQVKEEEPKLEQLILSDATPEATGIALQSNPHGVTLFRDELIGFFKDLKRYNINGEQQNLLSAFSGSPYKVNRVNRPPIFVRHPFINIVGGLQSDLLKELASDSRDVSGFLARILFVMPEIHKTPLYTREELPDSVKVERNKLIHSLHYNLKYEDFTLSQEAHAAYESFYNKNKHLNNLKGYSDHMRMVNSKMDIHVLRIALVLHCIQLVYEDKGYEISLQTMRHAIKLAEYFRFTAGKVGRYLTGTQIDKKDLILQLSRMGHGQRKIADIVGVAQPYVSQVIKKHLSGNS